MDGIVDVAGGRIQGIDRGGVWTYAGVPFAAPPVGDLRWRPPQPVVSWAGVRPAMEFGPVARQSPPVPGMAIPGDPTEQSEDCLTLNVWTPAPDGGRRPVMVWFHGGGFTSGTGAGLLYRGGPLARRGDVVVVTANYRLGALGYLAHPSLTDPATGAFGNWGLLDQIAVLRWVHDHIADLGGDPSNVTIFGESAGAMSVCVLCGTPGARGLFHRAIVQSGGPYAHSPERAQEAAEDLAQLLGLSSVTREILQKVPADDLVAATQQLQDRPPRAGELPLPFLPVVGDPALPERPESAVAAGSIADVPLLIGTNRDELAFFAAGTPEVADLDDDHLIHWVARAAPTEDARRLVAGYRAARTARGESVTPRDLWIAIGTDVVFRRPSLRFAAAHHAHQPATFVYLFTQTTPAFGGVLGSCHALEIPFVFGGLHRPLVAAFAGGDPAALALSDQMQDAWLAFARYGDPSTPPGPPGLGPWPRWDPDRMATMVLGPYAGVVDAPLAEELASWGSRIGDDPSDRPGGAVDSPRRSVLGDVAQ